MLWKPLKTALLIPRPLYMFGHDAINDQHLLSCKFNTFYGKTEIILLAKTYIFVNYYYKKTADSKQKSILNQLEPRQSTSQFHQRQGSVTQNLLHQ